MSNLLKFLIVGSTLIIILVACAPSGEREQVPADDDAPEVQISPESETATPTSQAPTENSPKSQGGRNYDELEIVTLLPRDGIPAIDNPEFLSVEEADEEYAPEELVIGVNYDGDARAYSIPFLSRHEIVNDTVGGRKIAVTW